MFCEFLLHSKVIHLRMRTHTHTHTHTHILFHILFHYGLSHNIEDSSQVHTVETCCLFTLYFILQFLKFAFHLQLLQNVSYISRVVQIHP